MKKHKKNARPTAATVKRAVETGTGQTTTSKTDFNTGSAPGQAVHIADFLSPGATNAIPLRDLVSITGLRERDVRRQIEQERRAGTLIVSDNRRGYWLAVDPEEAQRFARSMLHRSHEIAKTALVIEGAAGLGK